MELSNEQLRRVVDDARPKASLGEAYIRRLGKLVEGTRASLAGQEQMLVTAELGSDVLLLEAVEYFEPGILQLEGYDLHQQRAAALVPVAAARIVVKKLIAPSPAQTELVPFGFGAAAQRLIAATPD